MKNTPSRLAMCLLITLCVFFTTCINPFIERLWEHPEAPAIMTSILPGGIIGEVYDEVIAAAGTGSLTWRITDGRLPDGLELTQDGRISGTPLNEGEFDFHVELSNRWGTDGRWFSIRITIGRVTPVITTT